MHFLRPSHDCLQHCQQAEQASALDGLCCIKAAMVKAGGTRVCSHSHHTHYTHSAKRARPEGTWHKRTHTHTHTHIHNTHTYICIYIYIYVSKCSLYVFTIIPPRLTDPQQFHYCTDSNPGTGADNAFVLKRGMWRNATWPSCSRPAIAASARHFQICFLP